jgi:hypothetical protein
VNQTHLQNVGFRVRTPIRLHNNKVWAWFWNGQERRGSLPVFRLRPGNEIPSGSWRNGRVLQIPYTQNFIQINETSAK